jgi:hypothetical protein
MRTQRNLAIGVATAAVALSACGVAVGISAGTSAGAPGVASARHAPSDAGSADLRVMAQVKRDIVGRAVEPSRVHAGPRGVLGGGRSALSSDGGLAGCASLSGAHQVAASDYPKIAALFASSRWPDLRISGLGWVEIVTKQRSMRAYGGETVWFYQRLSAACAKHGQPLAS